jgi:CyaY protein
MTESEFLALAEQTLAAIESALEQAVNDSDLDIECSRSGNVLEIELVEQGSKIIVNSQSAMQELWVAARAGGFHYRREGGRWINTRDGSELYASLSAALSAQGGAQITLTPPA